MFKKITQIIFILSIAVIFSSIKASAATMSSETYSVESGRVGSGIISIPDASSVSYQVEASYGEQLEYIPPALTPTQEDDTPVLGGGGGGEGVFQKKYIGDFSVLVNNGDAITPNRVVTLTLNGGLNAKKMAISNTEDFKGMGQETYASSRTWFLPEGGGEKTVYVLFYDQSGVRSDVVTDSIILKLSPLNTEAKVADIDKDGDIDAFDFNIFIVNWGSTDCENVADLDYSCLVDIFDFNYLMVHWTG